MCSSLCRTPSTAAALTLVQACHSRACWLGREGPLVMYTLRSPCASTWRPPGPYIMPPACKAPRRVLNTVRRPCAVQQSPHLHPEITAAAVRGPCPAA